MPLFDQPIESTEHRSGFRLNVVSFTGNGMLLRAAQSVAGEFDSAEVLVEETSGQPDVFLAQFPRHDQRLGRAIATVVRDAGFREAGSCYAAVRYDSGPENDVDYLVAFE